MWKSENYPRFSRKTMHSEMHYVPYLCQTFSHSSRLWNKAQNTKTRHETWPSSPLPHYHKFCQICCLKSEEIVTQFLCIRLLVKTLLFQSTAVLWMASIKKKTLALQTTQFPKLFSRKNCLGSLQSSLSQEFNTFIWFYCFGCYS